MVGLDHSDSHPPFTSELGIEFMRLKMSDECLDATSVKNIIVTAEDTSIALRLSELAQEIEDKHELEQRSMAVKRLRLDLLNGQQCIRDFFICLQQNSLSWPDVCSFFNISIKHSTTCCACGLTNEYKTDQIHVELDVPQENTYLNDTVEEFFNSNDLVGRFCEDGCKTFAQAERRSRITSIEETQYIIVVLSRALETVEGFKLVKNKVIPTRDVQIR